MRFGQIFLDEQKKNLKEYNYDTDQDKVEMRDGYFTFYHYTLEDRLPQIFAEGSGLWAWREVACPSLPKELEGAYLIEGFLSPLPEWLTTSRYYNDLGYELTSRYIGDVLLQVTVPGHLFEIYIADYAHVLACKQSENRETSEINFGYDCSSGRECTQAYVNSYIPLKEYVDQHHAPIVQVIRRGEGVTVPKQFIKVCDRQPRKLKEI